MSNKQYIKMDITLQLSRPISCEPDLPWLRE